VSTGGRVIFLNRFFHPDESATSQLLSDLAVDLASRGVDVHVVCSRQLYGNAAARLPPREVVRGVAVHRLWTTHFGRRSLPGRALDYASFYVGAACVLAGRLKRSDIVIAMTDPPLMSIVAALAVRIKRARLINWLQDVFPEVASELDSNPLPPFLDRRLRRWRDASLRAACMNVVIGRRMQEFLLRRGVRRDTIRVIENWACAEPGRPRRADESELRASIGYAQKFVVGYSGNLGRAHEYEIFLDAAAALQADAQVQFLFIGGGAHMDALRVGAARRGLDNIRFLPYQPRESLADSLAAADVHLVSLLPALEGLIVPSKFYGILAAGRPVLFIGDPDGELAREIRDSNCGLSIPAASHADLVAAIRDLRANVERRTAMGERARALFRERFDVAFGLERWAGLVAALRGIDAPVVAPIHRD
jgi:glycosyltransferase involved in cell wall biosynthesis